MGLVYNSQYMYLPKKRYGDNAIQYIQKQLTQSTHLWSLFNQIDFSSPPICSTTILQELLGLASVLEEGIELNATLINEADLNSVTPEAASIIGPLIKYYTLPELHPKQVKFSPSSLSEQLLSTDKFKKHTTIPNYFDILSSPDEDMNMMEIDQPSQTSLHTTLALQNAAMKWDNDAGNSALTEDLFTHMMTLKQKSTDASVTEPEISTKYKSPSTHISSETKVSQRIRFNLIRHRGTVSDIPILKLFISFLTTLKKADSSLIILPFQASKQHYSSISTIKQIQSWKNRNYINC